jgi:hypothetical protein
MVVMSTLGFVDITFTSDTGRLFSIVVLLSGVVFLLVMTPFLFIRLFYAPWLEARVRLRGPADAVPTIRREPPPDRAQESRSARSPGVTAAVRGRSRTGWLPWCAEDAPP